MPSFRKILFWSHLCVAVPAGLFIAVIAFSGMLLAFAPQVTAWAGRVPGSQAQNAPGAARMSLDALAARAASSSPQLPLSGIVLRRDPAAAVLFQFGKDSELGLDPYSGSVVVDPAKGAKDFFKKVESLHRCFAMEGKAKEAASQLKAAVNLLFLFLLLSGLYLWFPWKPGRGSLRKGLQGKQRDFNWHMVFGIWALPWLLLISLSGLVMSYGWANNLLYRATGNEAPQPPAAMPAQGHKHALKPGGGLASLDAYLSAAEAQAPDWSLISLRLPKPGAGSVAAMIQEGDLAPPRGRGTLTLEAKGAKVISWEPFDSQNEGRKLRSWARWAHTGQAFGWPGQCLAFLASFAALIQIWSGLALAWRRFFIK